MRQLSVASTARVGCPQRWRQRWPPAGLLVGPADPPRTTPARDPAGTLPSRFRARVRSSTISALVRHRSRTASAAGVGMPMATSSPARCNLASRRQSRVSVLIRSPGVVGISDGAITSQPIPMRSSSRATRRRSARLRSRLAASGDRPGGQRACESTPRHGRSAPPRAPHGRTLGIPTEMVSLWTSRPRWIGASCVTLATAGSSVCWLRPQRMDDPRRRGRGRTDFPGSVQFHRLCGRGRSFWVLRCLGGWS